MAEKPSKLGNADSLDPIARAAGADTENDQFMERYGEDVTTGTDEYAMTDDTDDRSEETEQIKAQIEETRSQLGETIDAIQERLTLSNVTEQVSEQVTNVIESATGSLYDATIGKVVHSMKSLTGDISNSRAISTVRSNPLPIALIGLGAGMLVYQSYGRQRRPIRGLERFQSSGSYDRETNFEGRNLSAGRSGETTGQSTVGRAYEGVAGAASSAASTVSSAANSALDTVSTKVSGVYSGAGDAVNRVYSSAGELGTKATETYEHYLEENPLAVGAVAAAIGAAVGFALPSTRYESQLMGEARQNLMDKAQHVAGDLVERARHVADEAGKTIKDEAKSLTQ
jgi:ElaB/YqjD/DUF883 family membrane-anchored ribosome-binding protein